MIVDFANPESPRNYKAKICVIGSGPIGLSFAAQFLEINTSLLIVESGDMISTSENDELNRVVTTGDAVSGGPDSRARVFGGTSTLWGGQAIPLSEQDFRHREWVANSGWPIKFEDLSTYFERASQILKIKGPEFDDDVWQRRLVTRQAVEDENLRLKFSKWSPFPDFSKKYKKTLTNSSNVNMVMNATVKKLNLRANGESVDAATLVCKSGKKGRIRADIFVLCAGGIENPRILLCSTDVYPDGIGNQHGNVGRYYQDHVGYYGAQLLPRNRKRFVDLFAGRFQGDLMYLPKLQLSEARQQRAHLLNIVGNTGFQHVNESTVALKRVFNDIKTGNLDMETARNAARSLGHPLETLQLVVTYSVNRRQYLPKHATYFLIANCETEPDRESTISLSGDFDKLGIMQVSVNWKLGENVKRTLKVYYEVVQKKLHRLDIADSKVKKSLFDEGDEWKERVFSLFHHIGATRMSDDQKNGVVKNDCRVHGVSNLYIGGCSVFPTSGAANPTYTAMALVLRLADHVKHRI